MIYSHGIGYANLSLGQEAGSARLTLVLQKESQAGAAKSFQIPSRCTTTGNRRAIPFEC